MTDEKYVYTQDVREKKITARSARHTRTHCGKGGRVRLPSDNLSKRELQKLNGEVKTYQLNSPVSWEEFKSFPNEIKIEYIKRLRERFRVPDSKIGEMFGVSQKTISMHLIDLKCSSGKGKNCPNWDKEGFRAWCNGEPLPACSAESVEASFKEDVEKGLASLEDIAEPVPVPMPEIKMLPVREEKAKVIPHSGTMTLEGRLEDVLNTVTALLGGAKVSLCISWEVRPEEGVCEHGE